MDVSTQQVAQQVEQLELTQTEEPVDMSESEALLEEKRSDKKERLWRILVKVARYVRTNLLLILIVLGVLGGLVIGLAVREAHPSDVAIELIAFPGDIFLRALKMLILPLIVFSLIAGLGTLNVRTAGALGIRTILYYATTTALAVSLGLILVITIRPGDNRELAIGCTNQSHSMQNELDTLDSILDLIR